MRQPVEQVLEIARREDGIAGAPDQQCRDVGESGQAGRHPIQRHPARMVCFERDVGYEVTHRSAPSGPAVRGRERPLDRRRHCGPGDGRGAPDEGRCADADQFAERGRPGQPDQRGWSGGGGLVHAGVGQHDPRHLVGVCQGPAEGDRAAPVVGDQDDRAGQPEGGCQGAEVVDPLGERARRVGALRPAHAELVDRDHPPARGCLGEEAPPEVGPGGIPVHAQHDSTRAVGAVVQQVPAVRHAVAVGDPDGARPGRIESRQNGANAAARRRFAGRDHQASSAYEVFRPEPMPSRITCMPERRSSRYCASVNGTAAGPMLP